MIEKATFWKSKVFGQSYFEAGFATSQCTLTAPHHRVKDFKFFYFSKSKVVENKI